MEPAPVLAPAVVQFNRAQGGKEPGAQAVTHFDLAKVEVGFDAFIPGIACVQKAQHGDFLEMGTRYSTVPFSRLLPMNWSSS